MGGGKHILDELINILAGLLILKQLDENRRLDQVYWYLVNLAAA